MVGVRWAKGMPENGDYDITKLHVCVSVCSSL